MPHFRFFLKSHFSSKIVTFTAISAFSARLTAGKLMWLMYFHFYSVNKFSPILDNFILYSRSFGVPPDRFLSKSVVQFRRYSDFHIGIFFWRPFWIFGRITILAPGRQLLASFCSGYTYTSSHRTCHFNTGIIPITIKSRTS